MAIFKKRNTLVENMAYMAIMATINVVFVLISTLVPFLLFLLIFILPLSSSIVAIYCKKRYYPIYAIATVGLCLLVTIWNIGDTFYYVIPSLITGFLFGVLINKNIPSLIQISIVAFIQMGLSFLTIFIFEKLFTGRNYLDDISYIFGLQNYQYINYIKSMFLYVTSLIQTIFAYMVITNELSKFNIECNKVEPKLIHEFEILIISALLLISLFIIPSIAYPLGITLIMLGSYLFIINVKNQKKIIQIPTIISPIITIVLFFCLYKIIPTPLNFITLSFSPFLHAIIGLVNNSLENHNKKV